nr:hypothetical protein Itr_chr05CG13860 [Ipomoea trifida]
MLCRRLSCCVAGEQDSAHRQRTPPGRSATSLNGEKQRDGEGRWLAPPLSSAKSHHTATPSCCAMVVAASRTSFEDPLEEKEGRRSRPKLVAAAVRTAAKELLSAHGCS